MCPAVSRGPARPVTLGVTLDDAFGRHAARAPAATAVIDGDRRLSYAELDAAAGAYAAELARLGVRRGSRVPIACPRSAEFVAAALGVLRLGAAYAGIDSRWPRGRVTDVIRRLRPPAVVADPAGDAGALAAEAGVPAWAPGPLAGPGAGLVGGRPPGPHRAPDQDRGEAAAAADGDAVCCIYFTSGSTGEPKGVLARHKGILRLFEPPSFARFGPGLVMPVAASPAWDGLSLELWSPLATGGTAVIVREPYLDPVTLRLVISAYGANTVLLTTSLFVMVVDEDPAALTGLSQIFAAGERLPAGQARRFLREHPGIRLLNIYGPAEAGIITTARQVTLADCDRPDGVPIGSPVANTELYVVDDGALVPDGGTGELYIGGDGLAEGYLDDPVLTVSKFPLLQAGGSPHRVHRSGDLVRFGSDGLLSYLGRVDRQVKIRGHRVEPSETEQAIRRLPGVRSAAVVPRPAPGGGYRDLVACYTADEAGGQAPDPAGVADQLRAVLPAYLVPAVVRRVGSLPLRPNGKLDAEQVIALADAGGTAGEPSAGGARPGGGVLDEVASMFTSVLGQPVPQDASAFELGATSLDAGRLCARLSQRFGTPVPLSVFMAKPTAAAIAHWLGRAVRAPRPDHEAAGGAVPLTDAQTGFWYAHHLAPDDLAAHCAIVFHIAGPVSPQAIAQGLADVQDRHEALRARYGPDGRPAAVVTTGRPVPLVRCPDPDAVLPVLSEPFDLAAGDVWRAALAVASGGATLGIAVHHIAFDGWSEAVLTRDLAVAYAARLAGNAPAFPIRAPGLAELAAARLHRLASVDLAAQRAFWQRYLAGLPELRLPGRGDGSGVGILHVADVASASLALQARQLGATPFALLLAAYAGALAVVSGQRDFGIGVPVALRDAPEAADAVGCLLTTVCLRVPANGAGPAQLLAGARPEIAAAFGAADVPFDEVVKLVNPERTGRNPLFDVMLALQDTPPTELRLPGCAVRIERPMLGMSVGLVAEARAAGGGALRVELFHDRRRVAAATAGMVASAFAGQLALGGIAPRE